MDIPPAALLALTWHRGVFRALSHCVKNVRIRSYSDPHFPAFRLNTERYSVFSTDGGNADQNNSEYRHFSRSAKHV